MISPALGIAGVLAFLGGLFGLLKLLDRVAHPHPEVLRKLLHVGVGLAVISFPWVFAETWPVLLLAGISLVGLLALKYVPRLHSGVGSVMNGVHRPGYGEICFPIAVASLALLSRGDKLLFAVPMLIVTLADAVAALVGIAYGRVRYVTSEGLKSVEGSIAFFAIAFLSVHVPLLLFTSVGRAETLLIAATIGLLSMLIEAISARGLDNLLIPIGAYAFLRLYLYATPEALILRLVITVSLLIFVLVWRRRTSMDDSALMASALYGYGAWMLGGWEWLIGPLVLFLIHVGLWPRTTKGPTDSVWVLLSVVAPGLIWLSVQTAYPGRSWLFPYAVAFGTHLTIIGVSRIAVDDSRTPRLLRLGAAVGAGCLLILFQILPLLFAGPAPRSEGFPLILFAPVGMSVAVAGMIFYFSLPYLYGPKGSHLAIHSFGFALALSTSTLAALLPGHSYFAAPQRRGPQLNGRAPSTVSLRSLRGVLLLGIERRLHASGQIGRGADAPVVKENRPGLLALHVIVNGYYVDPALAQRLQHGLKFAFKGHKIAIDEGVLV